MFEPETFAIWPEHLEVLEMFLRCQTQWRSGPNGVIGLDYSVLGVRAVEDQPTV